MIEHDSKILCMQRYKGKFKWEFPGGKIEEETKQQAPKRELQEKMEVCVDVVEHFTDVVYEYPDFIITMYCYKCNAHSSEFKINIYKDFRRLTKENLNTLDRAAADQPIVKKLLAEQYRNKKEVLPFFFISLLCNCSTKKLKLKTLPN